ncbi:hypothetical protein [Tardiphaga sp.]|uniref:hypothetical protein n=1 Tax=Tardiphaga sp. TaxID=1926292 RepID=UPI0037D9A989
MCGDLGSLLCGKAGEIARALSGRIELLGEGSLRRRIRIGIPGGGKRRDMRIVALQQIVRLLLRDLARADGVGETALDGHSRQPLMRLASPS